jgi:hypothetical protein
MATYVVISSRLKAFTPGQIVTDEDLIAVGVEPLKSLAIGAIAQEVKNTKASRKYAKTITEETE